jgi:hypothetical protein
VYLRHSLVIACDPDHVFGWIEDPQRARLWQPDVADTEVLQAAPGMVGTVFRETLRDGRGSLEMRGRITEFVPGRSMAVLLEGQGVTVEARYVVVPHPLGARLEAEQRMSLPGRFARVLEPLVRRRVAQRARADLERLKSLCEAGTPPTDPGAAAEA